MRSNRIVLAIKPAATVTRRIRRRGEHGISRKAIGRIANAHANDSPSAPQAQIVANAFVALGRYYLNGIPNSKIKSDPERARETYCGCW
jgi:hypothetical protein